MTKRMFLILYFYLFLVGAISSCLNTGSLTVTDYAGSKYPVVKVGSIIWMAENLKTEYYQNGDKIGLSQDTATAGRSDVYASDQEHLDSFGRLYNWAACTDPRGICPEGFRLPTRKEWIELIVAAGGVNQGGAAVKNKNSWTLDLANTNRLGLNIKPGGTREVDGSYSRIGEAAFFWTSDSTLNHEQTCAWDCRCAWEVSFRNGTNYVLIDEGAQNRGMSVRCVCEKDYRQF